ncbi:MAG: MFS transporter [Pseudomonadota bacterium]|nr:MFS transporter [Pseudomonadota bacterium]
MSAPTASAPVKAPAGGRNGVLAGGCTAHFLHDGLTDSLYVLLPLWAEAFGLSHTQVGLLKTAFSGATGASQLPLGVLSERIGERALLAVGLCLAGILFAVAAWAGSYGMLILCLFLSGLACGVQHPLSSSIIARAFTQGGARAALGIYNFSGDLGKVAVPVSVAALAAWGGWQAGVLGYGLLLALAGGLLFLWLRRLRHALKPMKQHAEAATGKGWGFTDGRGFAYLSGVHLLDDVSRTGFLTFMPFVIISKGATTASVGFALALLFAGGAAGKLGCGLLAERLGLMRTVVLTEFATGVLVLLTLALPLNWTLAVLPLLGVVMNGTSSVLYGTVGDFVTPQRQARAFGLFYTVGSTASAAAPFLFGMLSDWRNPGFALVFAALAAFATLPLCLLLRRHLKD